jgi:hypothetical protein
MVAGKRPTDIQVAATPGCSITVDFRENGFYSSCTLNTTPLIKAETRNFKNEESTVDTPNICTE